MAKKRFLHILAPFLECKKAIFVKVVAKRGKCKKNHFFAEMAYTHVGTKYIKRPWDFENFLEFWSTLLDRHQCRQWGDQDSRLKPCCWSSWVNCTRCRAGSMRLTTLATPSLARRSPRKARWPDKTEMQRWGVQLSSSSWNIITCKSLYLLMRMNMMTV